MIILAIVGFLALDALFIVDQRQQCIVLQFGELKKVHKEPGLKFKVPFIQEVVYYEKRVLDYDLPPIDVTTLDQKKLVIDTYTRYRITDPVKFYKSVTPASEVGARAQLNSFVSSTVQSVMGQVLLRDTLSPKRAETMSQIEGRIRDKAKSIGLDIIDVRIIRTELPINNRKAVFARMNADLRRFAFKNRAEGEEAAKKIRSSADKDRTIILAEAEKIANTKRGEGESKALKIEMKAYAKSPELFDFDKRMKLYEESFDDQTSYVLSTNSDLLKNFKGFESIK